MKAHHPRIFFDRDTTLKYETNSWSRRLLNFFLIPLLNLLPGSLRGLARKTHRSAGGIIDKATSHEALEILYRDGEPHKTKGWLQAFFFNLWFTTNNPKAVRNRLRLVTRELSAELRKRFSDGKSVKILSIASGSARAVVDSLKLTQQETLPCSVFFLDKNPKALEYSKAFAKESALPSNYTFSWAEDTASNFPHHADAPDIVEMVGLLDYFSDEKVKELLALIREKLAPGGVLITANIRNNLERPFLTNFVGWRMVYREPEDFYELARAAGFRDDDLRVMVEPMGIHFVLVARK